MNIAHVDHQAQGLGSKYIIVTGCSQPYEDMCKVVEIYDVD